MMFTLNFSSLGDELTRRSYATPRRNIGMQNVR